MNCRELAELLLEFLNGELSEEFCVEVREHLGRCPPCVIILETYQITVKLSRKLCPPPLPEGLAQRLHWLRQHLPQAQERRHDERA